MRKILLISPMAVRESRSEMLIKDLPFLKKRALVPPLHIATIAALTPDDMEVDLWDEAVHGQLDEYTELPDYDLVGITGYAVHLPRARVISHVFRKRGVPVAIGGSGVSSVPERCRDDFDILFIGEAELTWPQFIADWEAGSYRKEYRQITKPDLAMSPIPRWDSIAAQMQNYLAGAVQTTRGCPFDCEFCDVIYLFGRRPRHKTIDKVLEEVVNLRRLGVERILLSDDNFIGNFRYAKELLRELISLNNSLQDPIMFDTQLSINLAKDDELLGLLARANFSFLGIGIETPNKKSLEETNKLHNLQLDLIEACKKIQSYGLPITTTMIVGFDHDTLEIFDQMFEFIQDASVANVGIHLLFAVPGTKLWNRLRREGRLLKADDERGYSMIPASTNIIPKRMTRRELFTGYLDLLERVYDWQNFAYRVKGMVSGIRGESQLPKRRRQRKRFLQTFQFFRLLDKDARSAVRSVLRHTRMHAPFMRERVLRLIGAQYLHATRVQLLREKLSKQMELEESLHLEQFIDRSDVPIAEAFEMPYREIFPQMHSQVHLGLKDKVRTDEALVEIFTDFLRHWGGTLDQFSDQHKAFLYELADRTIEKENDAVAGTSSLLLQQDEELPDIVRTHLANEVLKAVEQKLRVAESVQHQ